MSQNPYRNLPSVAKLLDLPAATAARARHPHAAVVAAVRGELEHLRALIAAGSLHDPLPDAETITANAIARLDRDATPQLRPVINATGVILHTNLGRSPLAEVAARAAYQAGRGYLNLEIDLASGKRLSRQRTIGPAVCRLTGAEAATAVNNCAAATVLVLRALAGGKEVVVSRGQLVEIGGGFRVPEVMAVSGAILREVGTTNITRLADYESAIGPNTGLLMRVHTSNYRVRGHTKAVGIDELAALGRKYNLLVVDDIGSGAALDFGRLGLHGEPVAAESIKAGVDLVLFSGDKLLGGPQAGVIAGRAELIRRVENDPFMRAVRLDKMSLAALEATLRLYADPESAVREIPTLRMMGLEIGELRSRAERFAEQVRVLTGIAAVEVLHDETYVGGGSFPDQPLPGVVVAVVSRDVSDEEFAARLRAGSPSVVGRVRAGKVLFDLRTVFERQDVELVAAIQNATAS